MPPPRLTPPTRWRKTAGFSLVEVTLAIGIVAFAFVALFGLVPTGLNVFRAAIDTSIGSQIVQQVVQNAQQSDYDLLLNQQLPDTYYDEQGDLLTTNGVPVTTSNDPRSIYRVHVTATIPTAIPAATQDAGTASTKNVATLVIQIAKDPGHSSNPFTAGNKANVNNFIAYVARNRSSL